LPISFVRGARTKARMREMKRRAAAVEIASLRVY
jgi:hypothetical protein